MANRYFAGNSLAAFYRSSTAITEATTAGRHDSTYVANSIAMTGNATDYIETPQFAVSATGTIWFKFSAWNSGSTMSGVGPTLLNGSTGVFRIIGTASTTYQAQYWNGSAWTNTGSTWTMSTSTLNEVVCKVVLGSSFEAYVGGTLRDSGSGWSGGGTTVTSIRAYSIVAGGNPENYSQIMAADYDIKDAHYAQSALNGNSATNTGGTGAYTDINETVLDESTAELVSTVGNKMGQTHATFTVPSAFSIAAMVIAARGRVSGGVVADGKLGVKSGSSSNSGSGKSFTSGYEPRINIIPLDPATGVAFTQSGLNSAESYIEAA
jgi:hypothetical protein